MSTISEKARPAGKSGRPRDPRLDFFRGLGMLIILVAHIPWNPWTNWIPARFGFSDAADMFVFCSGMASALAFARVFDGYGWLTGALRILHRVWQVYWAHIGSFLIVLAVAIAADQMLGRDHYVRVELNLQNVIDDPRSHLLGLMTLRFVPNYFDILPMYMVVLAMTPVVMALARISRALVFLFVGGMWAGAQAGWLGLSADADQMRHWFFNPFAWQLVFFTGFAFVRGWLPTPPRDGRLVALAIGVVLLAAPVSCQSEFTCHAGFGRAPQLGEIHDHLGWLIAKSEMGPLRYMHFLATAYLAWMAVGVRGSRLRGPVAEILRQIGQQTLAVFLAGLVVAQLLGIVLDQTGRGFLISTLANLAGFALLFLTARVTGFVKSPPWSRPPEARREKSPPEQDQSRVSQSLARPAEV